MQKPPATATADLQIANDNFSAAQSEIATKEQALADLQADPSQEGQRPLQKPLLQQQPLICKSRMTTFTAQSEIAIKEQALTDLQSNLETSEGQRAIAETALATATADLQIANDNFSAAQSEIAIKEQALADRKAPRDIRGSTAIAETALATATADLQIANDNYSAAQVRLQSRRTGAC